MVLNICNKKIILDDEVCNEIEKYNGPVNDITYKSMLATRECVRKFTSVEAFIVCTDNDTLNKLSNKFLKEDLEDYKNICCH